MISLDHDLGNDENGTGYPAPRASPMAISRSIGSRVRTDGFEKWLTLINCGIVHTGTSEKPR